MDFKTLSLAVCALSFALGLQAADSAKSGGKPAAREAFFGFDKLHSLHLSMSAKEWAAMQPSGRPGFGGFGGMFPSQSDSAPANPGDRATHRANMMEFPVSKGDLVEGETTYTNIAVRYKGNFTYMASSMQLKRSLKLDFELPDKSARDFHGLEKVNLHAGVTDPTRQREALGYEVFRACGVPAPRTAFAELTLTVPGKYDREFVGLYAVVEQVDKRFLKDRFGNSKGLLLKPQGVRGPDYLGERWDAYDARYRPDRAPTPEEARRVIAFAKLVSNAKDDEFRREIDAYLDVDEFLRFLAANAFLVNLDSPLAMPQNFYLYLDAQSQRFMFMPWDMDLALAAWPMGGPPEQQMDLSLLHPHVGEHKLIDRLLAIPAVKEKYKSILKELAAGPFAKERLLANIDVVERTTKESLAKETKAAAARRESGGGPGGGMAFGMFSRAPLPRTFVEKRTDSVQAQLSGAREGYVPSGGVSGGGFPAGGRPMRGRGGPPPQRPNER